MTIERVTSTSNLAAIAADIKPSEWDKDNDFSTITESSLQTIASNPDYLYLIAMNDDNHIVGILLAVKLLKTDGSSWLYIDELDTHPQWRRRGIARELMQEAFNHAKLMGAAEVWLGADQNNKAANAFYESLQPSLSEQFVGYTFEIK